MRILLSAFAFMPDAGSELGVGWHWARMLSERHEVHVLTGGFEWERVQEGLARAALPNLHVHRVAAASEGTYAAPRLFFWLHDYHWQWRALRAARTLHRQTPFDLAHHVTYASWRMPSFLWKLDIPFVWGPLGGGQDSPSGFDDILGPRGARQERIRRLFQRLCMFDPFVRQTMRHATRILAANTATLERIPQQHRHKASLLLETAFDLPNDAAPRPARSRTGPLELLWVGVFEPRKALPLALNALARLPQDCARLRVVGSGQEQARWQQMAMDAGLSERVHFLGQRPYEEVQRLYQDADAVLFSSLRDSSGNVILEAMRHSLPVICLDWSGPSEITDDACAIRIPAHTPAQVAADMASAIERLRDDTVRTRMGDAGFNQLQQHYTWKKKADQIEAIYRDMMSSAAIRR